MTWVVAGQNGMELWGFTNSHDINPRMDDGDEPDAIVKVSPLHWDFRFPSTAGSGRVRIGAGCSYNPLQMIEAMWGHVINIAGNEPTVIHIDFDEADMTFDPEQAWGEGFLAEWGDGDVE